MGKFDAYLLHPVRKCAPDDACVELITSKDHPILPFFYESRLIRRDFTLAEAPYALTNSEIFVFTNTAADDRNLGATLQIQIGNQTLQTDQNCMIAIPAFVPHGPIRLTNVTSAVLCYIAAPSREHWSLPKRYWKTDVPKPEDCVLFYNGDAENPDRPFGTAQSIVMKMVQNPFPGSTFSILRRFTPVTQSWVFATGTHLHDNAEILCFYPSDADDPYHLPGQCRLSVFGETHMIDQPTVAYFPPYLPHCPLEIGPLAGHMYWHSYAPDFKQYTSEKIEPLEEETDLHKPW